MKPVSRPRKSVIELTPAAIAEKLGVSERTAFRWLAGDTQPGDAHAAALRELGWTGKPAAKKARRRPSPKKPKPAAADPAVEALPEGLDHWPPALAALARLRVHRRAAERRGELTAWLRLAVSELRAVRALHDTTDPAGRRRRQVFEHIFDAWLRLEPAGFDFLLEALVQSGETVVNEGPVELLTVDDDPEPDGGTWGIDAERVAIDAMLRRLARWRGHFEASGDLNTIGKFAELERKAHAMRRRIRGDLSALVRTEEYAAARWRMIGIFEASPEGLRHWADVIAGAA
jgi:hypothetical protein